MARQRHFPHLLGGHVGGGADPGHLGQIIAGEQCGAKIRHLDVPAGRAQKQVCGLDVPVGDPLLVGVVQGARALEDDLHHLIEGEQAVGGGMTLKRAARHILHDDVALLLIDHGIKNLDDVGV